MADAYDEAAPEEEAPAPVAEELSEQERLKLELMKLKAAEASVASPAEMDAKKAEGVEKLKAVMASNAQKVATEKPVESQAPPEPVETPPVEVPDIGKLSTAPIRTEGFTPSEPLVAKNVNAIQRADWLKEKRAPLAREIESNPELKLRVAALLDLENVGAGPAVVESLLNRALYSKRSVDSITSLGRNSFYGPGRIAGMVEGRMAEIARNPQKREQLFNLIREAYTSNTVKGHTDQGSLRDPNYQAGGIGVNINRERFNDWGGGPGGHAGARAFRTALNAHAGAPYLPADELRALLNPTPSAQQKDTVQGGGMESPKAIAQIEALMQGVPIEQIKNMAGTVEDAGEGKSTQITRGTRVPTSRVSHTEMPQGIIPGAEGTMSQHNMPMPGLMPNELGQTYLDMVSPSMRSTINNYQALNAPPPIEVKQPEAKPAEKPKPNFLQALITTMNTLSPINWTKEGLQTAAEVGPEALKSGIMKPGEGVAQVGQGLLSGVQDLPVAMTAGVAVPAAAITGILSGSDTLKQFAAQTAADADVWKTDAQKRVGIDPSNPTGAQWLGHQLGSNLGMGMAKTGVNAAFSTVAERFLGPAAAYMAKNYPIPELGLSTPANAAPPNAFGKVPIIVNTPGGPLVMNAADLQQFAWGGAFAVGFGTAFPVASKTVHAIRHFKPLGLDAVFDPRRAIPGAEGTEAASLPIDKLKAGIIDQGKAMIDIAMRQFNYERGVSTGIDPIAANEVLQAWRVQTNSGAQNLIRQALTNGEMNVPEFRFKVNTSIQKLTEFSKVNPDFPEYLRIRAIADEINYNSTVNSQLPTTSTAQRPVVFKDHNGIKFEKGTNGPGDVDNVIAHYEGNNTGFKQAYDAYRDNLEATRDLITSHPTNNIENYVRLTDKAIERPTLPIFSAEAKTKDLFDDFLAGKNPLEVAEHNMRMAFEKQMRFDAEQKYIGMTQQNVGSKAFTKRDAAWVEAEGAKAKDVGGGSRAVLCGGGRGAGTGPAAGRPGARHRRCRAAALPSAGAGRIGHAGADRRRADSAGRRRGCLAHAAAPGVRVPRRLDHGLARRHGGGTRDPGRGSGDAGRRGRHGHDPGDRQRGHDERGLRSTHPRCERRAHLQVTSAGVVRPDRGPESRPLNRRHRAGQRAVDCPGGRTAHRADAPR